MVGHAKSVRPETKTQHCYMQEVFIWKRKTVTGINITMANYEGKIPHHNDQYFILLTILTIVQLLTPMVQ